MGTPRVVVVSESWAKRSFGDEDPIGKVLHFEDEAVEIVGVVGDVRYTRFDEGPAPAMYLSRAQSPSELMCVVARTALPLSAIAPLIHRAVREIDPALPAMHLTTIGRIIDESVAERRFYTVATASFAGLALLLTVGGLAIVVARVVAERSRELAIRSALGAGATRLVSEAARSGMRAVAVGVSAGVAVTYVGAGMWSRFLFEIPARFPAAYLLTAAGMLLVTGLAAAVPARRVLKLSVATMLRSE
jgi:hypothetical protein